MHLLSVLSAELKKILSTKASSLTCILESSLAQLVLTFSERVIFLLGHNTDHHLHGY